MTNFERVHLHAVAIFVKILGLIIFGAVPFGGFIYFLINAVQKTWLVTQEEVTLIVFSGALLITTFLTIIPTIIISFLGNGD